VSHVIVWQFVVLAGHEHEFEEAYGPHGAWAELFAKSSGFRGTELLRDASASGRYLTIDRWETAEAFEEFRGSHGGAYQALDARCSAWTESEVRIGAYGEWGSLDSRRRPAPHRPVDSRVHHALLSRIAIDGHAPSIDAMAQAVGAAPEEVEGSLRRLHANHGLVLQPGSMEVWVAHPFALSPTAVSVATGPRVFWAPCVWCAMGVVALAAPSADIRTRFGGETEELVLRVRDGKILDKDIVVHFAMPPRDAWNNVIHYCATVLPFRRGEDVEPWCARHRLPKGAIVPVEQVLELGRAWYGRHLDVDWVKWTPAQAQAIFERVGLVDRFWSLPQEKDGPF
jgi:heme-degrading monooxygenase HmoA